MLTDGLSTPCRRAHLALSLCRGSEIGIGRASRFLSSHTTVHTGPYTAVQE